MTKHDWLAIARENEQDLCQLIHNFHPTYRRDTHSEMHITAFGAEAACQVVREAIQLEMRFLDPADAFKCALESGDDKTISTILQETWFGVPESTACWKIAGFMACVNLLEDPIEEENEHDYTERNDSGTIEETQRD